MDKKQIFGISEQLAAFDRALTAEEVAKLFSLSPHTILKQARTGEIPCIRIGTSVRFDPRKLSEWVERQTIDLHGEIEKRRKKP